MEKNQSEELKKYSIKLDVKTEEMTEKLDKLEEQVNRIHRKLIEIKKLKQEI